MKFASSLFTLTLSLTLNAFAGPGQIGSAKENFEGFEPYANQKQVREVLSEKYSGKIIPMACVENGKAYKLELDLGLYLNFKAYDDAPFIAKLSRRIGNNPAIKIAITFQPQIGQTVILFDQSEEKIIGMEQLIIANIQQPDKTVTVGGTTVQPNIETIPSHVETVVVNDISCRTSEIIK